tara:strand:- start:321 stop:842 length:522 start_codon:yes stop_codon:yes gene_type:complete
MDNSFNENEKEKEREKHNAANIDGTPLMSGFGMVLDKFYLDRRYSTILSLNRKILSEEVTQNMVKINGENCAYSSVNQDHTLLNKYKAGETYKSHKDSSSFTALTFLAKDTINGGDLYLSEYELIIPFKNNSCVIFPSRVYHNTESFESEVDRFAIAQFMNIIYYPGYKNESY